MTTETDIRLGTSAFTAAGWEGAFYPPGMKPSEYLGYYATRFDTVEVDSTFYHAPSEQVVKGWYRKTPAGFLFAAKVPQIITHEKVLRDCDEDLKQFLQAMDCLDEKLGPLLFQFRYFNKKAFPHVKEFLARLAPFLKKLPKGYRFAVEIRNKNWLVPEFVDTVRACQVALALVDHVWMPRPRQLFQNFDPITADFAYVRWIGDRKGIEEKTKTWNKIILGEPVKFVSPVTANSTCGNASRSSRVRKRVVPAGRPASSPPTSRSEGNWRVSRRTVVCFAAPPDETGAMFVLGD